MHGIVLVRRGVIVRQRVDAHGHATAIDAIGPGGAMPLGDRDDGGTCGYAADDALVCVCPKTIVHRAVDAGGGGARDVVRLHAMALERVEKIADARSRASAVACVATLLCALADTLSPPRRLPVVPAALQQRDLAALLAMRHESVCRAIAHLVRRGAISKEAEGLRITGRQALEAVASS